MKRLAGVGGRDQKPRLVARVSNHQQINLKFYFLRIVTRNGYETNIVAETALDEFRQSSMVCYG